MDANMKRKNGGNMAVITAITVGIVAAAIYIMTIALNT